MTRIPLPSGPTLLGSATALALVLGTASQPAFAAGGDITRGVIMGLATGVAVDELRHNAQRPQRQYVYVEHPRRRVYQHAYVAPAPRLSPLGRAFDSQDRRLRISIQSRLMQDGLYHATIDGLWGPATQDALHGYARRHNQLSMLTNEGDANRLFADILR